MTVSHGNGEETQYTNSVSAGQPTEKGYCNNGPCVFVKTYPWQYWIVKNYGVDFWGETEPSFNDCTGALFEIPPTDMPTDEPTWQPTDEPTWQTTDEPTWQTTDEPTWQPTDKPTRDIGQQSKANFSVYFSCFVLLFVLLL